MKIVKTLCITALLTIMAGESFAHRTDKAHRHVTREQLQAEEDKRLNKLRAAIDRTHGKKEPETPPETTTRNTAGTDPAFDFGDVDNTDDAITEKPRDRRKRQRREARAIRDNRRELQDSVEKAAQDFRESLTGSRF